MFDKFGEFNSAEEINETAAGLLKEGDLKGLREMAKENGFDEDDVQDYIDGIYPELANTYTAAWNKLDVEMKELKVCEIMEDWVEYIRIKMEEEEEMQRAIRKKGKSLQGCIAALMKWGFKHQYPISNEIMKEAGVTASKVTLGIPGMGTAKKVITKYYLGK
nr:MAG TPA: PcfK-like protein [Caudoviricetes sp.]